MVPIRIEGVVDPNGDPVPVRVTGITQDEAVGTGHGATCPDGAGIGTDEAVLRAERDAKGDGRVYTVSFTARDSNGIECTGAVRVCVPHDQAHPTCGDDGPRANSVGPCSASAK